MNKLTKAQWKRINGSRKEVALIAEPLSSQGVQSITEAQVIAQRGQTHVRDQAVSRVVLHWSRRKPGLNANSMAAAWTALHRLSGQEPMVHYSQKSVAAWRLRQGDCAGVSVTRTGQRAMDMVRLVLNSAERLGELPDRRQTNESSSGKTERTMTIEKPRSRPMLEAHYELFRTRIGVKGLSMTYTVSKGRRHAVSRDRMSQKTAS